MPVFLHSFLRASPVSLRHNLTSLLCRLSGNSSSPLVSQHWERSAQATSVTQPQERHHKEELEHTSFVPSSASGRSPLWAPDPLDCPATVALCKPCPVLLAVSSVSWPTSQLPSRGRLLWIALPWEALAQVLTGNGAFESANAAGVAVCDSTLNLCKESAYAIASLQALAVASMAGDSAAL